MKFWTFTISALLMTVVFAPQAKAESRETVVIGTQQGGVVTQRVQEPGNVTRIVRTPVPAAVTVQTAPQSTTIVVEENMDAAAAAAANIETAAGDENSEGANMSARDRVRAKMKSNISN